MDKGLVMFGIFILVLGILIPIIQSINANKKEGFENSENELEQLQDEIENFYQEKKTLKKAETQAKANTAKTEQKTTKAVVKVVQDKQNCNTNEKCQWINESCVGLQFYYHQMLER